jgi:hypothetical protein
MALARMLMGGPAETQGTAFEPVTRQQQMQNWGALNQREDAWRTAEGSPWKPAEPGAMAKMIGRMLASEPAERLMTLSMFLGPGAKTANLGALTKAQAAAAKGAPREQIWSDHGWFQGPDKKWRFEIDDRKAYSDLRAAVDEGVDVGSRLPVDNLFGHKALFEAYPHLAKMDARIFPDGSPFALSKGEKAPVFMAVPKNATDADARLKMLHEMQHRVARDEGMARGGNPDHVGGMENYKRLAGEVEARAVEKRADMTPKQRAARPPWLDYDVPEAHQIIK